MITGAGLLAQATQPAGPPTPGAVPPLTTGEIFMRQIFPLLLVIIVFWWVMSRGRNKERQAYEAMLGSLQRNDRVLTTSGIIGTVVDVRDTEIVLKVDESNNVKMRFAKHAIKEKLATPT